MSETKKPRSDTRKSGDQAGPRSSSERLKEDRKKFLSLVAERIRFGEALPITKEQAERAARICINQTVYRIVTALRAELPVFPGPDQTDPLELRRLAIDIALRQTQRSNE